ncbi:MAG: peptide chain release factor N(5)-glutamine methyltransferase [Chitinophagaceae bacterium]|nr:peptide chain release factor N(5)-glutamine methyltransferase [Chitinophagaceae bacterium]
MTISEASSFVRDAIRKIYDAREAENITHWVLEKITGLNKINLLLKRNRVLTDQEYTSLNDYTTQLLQHRPVQYVLEEAWFCGMPLYVDENVLIPRPETEELVAWIISDAEKNPTGCDKKYRILDIGTGSGCIAIALKKNLPACEVYAIDVSEGALAVARKNAESAQCTIQFLNINILDPRQSGSLPVFDIIVSNPPYVPLKDKEDMNPNVLLFEPHTALFVEDHDPLSFYLAIGSLAKRHLHKNGGIYVEIHESMGESIQPVFASYGLNRITVKKDMQGKDRMAKAVKTD